MQFQTLFIGYDLQGFVDGRKPCPPQHLITDDSNTPNPEYYAWVRQDQLILIAFIGLIHQTIILVFARETTSQEAEDFGIHICHPLQRPHQASQG